MQDATLQEIQERAQQLARSKRAWHFHILAPGCLFNDRPSYALILEDVDGNQRFICYLQEKPSDVGKELAALLHGSRVFQQEEGDENYVAVEQVQHMVWRAKELNGQGVEWHHHMLFPGCAFNKHGQKFTLVFEDPEKHAVIENVTEEEPTGDLKLIEKLFYAQ